MRSGPVAGPPLTNVGAPDGHAYDIVPYVGVADPDDPEALHFRPKYRGEWRVTDDYFYAWDHHGRSPEFVTHEERVRVREWKMARGVWRARNLALRGRLKQLLEFEAASNDPAAILFTVAAHQRYTIELRESLFDA